APVPLQLAYQAWVTHTATVLRQQEQLEQPRPSNTDSTAERGNILQRAVNTLRFLWLLCKALVDGLTQWLDSQTQDHMEMSQVLCLERFVMAERLAQGEEINEEFPGELYHLLPEEFLQELNLPSPLAADFESGTSRQVHRYPRGAAPSSSSQDQVINVEEMVDIQQFLASPQQRKRTASELLKSR
ncbi:PIEZ1 protein, partial [Prunella himalayana]|nr:PIEZ1 protein [Prunella himalayana]